MMMLVGIIVAAVVVGGVGYYAGHGMVGTTVSTSFQTVTSSSTITSTQTTTLTTTQTSLQTTLSTVSGGSGATVTVTTTSIVATCNPPASIQCVPDIDGDGK